MVIQLLFNRMFDTRPSSQEMTLGVLRLIAGHGGSLTEDDALEYLIQKMPKTDNLTQRRYRHIRCLALIALKAAGLVSMVWPETGNAIRYHISVLGSAVSKDLSEQSLGNTMQELDAMRGYTQQTTFLKGTDLVVPQATTKGPGEPAVPPETKPTKRAIKARSIPTQVTLEEILARPFNLAEIIDERERVLAEVARRHGQGQFRDQLLALYDNRCAITGCDVVDALDAAHIQPYQGPTTNHPANGMILRTDLHTLFDLGLLTIDTSKFTVIIAPALSEKHYGCLHGQSLRLPGGDYHICTEALDIHRVWAEKRWAQVNL